MMVKSFISSKATISKSATHGRGLFATKPIQKGEIIGIKGGHIIDRKTLASIEDIVRDSELQITDNFYLAPLRNEERNNVMMYLNHSCSPNIGVEGSIVFVAMRDIKVGEELTIDYVMIDDASYKMSCKCESKNCRKIITGKDWKRPGLQHKYRGYFSTFLQKKMAEK